MEFYYTVEGFRRRNELVEKEMAFGFYYFLLWLQGTFFESDLPVLELDLPSFDSDLPCLESDLSIF